MLNHELLVNAQKLTRKCSNVNWWWWINFRYFRMMRLKKYFKKEIDAEYENIEKTESTKY
ncbi:hypothetical protein HYD72_02355 [Mycoplasmopsis bovis]|nr:hypothetical protein [Mycoplasmopsis bovis]QQH49318.1 hypothetical protein HYD72_02355 [Mycoplasmopsis bovis]